MKKFLLFSKGTGNGHKTLPLEKDQRVLYNAIMTTLEKNLSGASVYARKKCTNCCGKGYSQRDTILPKGVVLEEHRLDGGANRKFVRHSPSETYVCDCVQKTLKQEIINGKPRKEYR